MSCNHCNTKFNFFHRELGCSTCGLSFCSKCLKKGPNLCKLCFSKSSSGQTSEQSNVPPPDKFIKRLENLQNPTVSPVKIYKQDVDSDAFKSGLNAKDKELVERLEKIKNDGKRPVPSDSEIRQRLAKLKGQNEYVETSSKPLFTVDKRTDQEKIDSLLEQFNSEKDIELAHNPANEIEVRLAALREQGVRPNEGSYISNLQDSSGSEEEIDKITKKVMAEVALEEKPRPQT
ncbi:unnamed protein product [Phaedon cochleariae]|uniref:Phorbol-ester/DAG-type domain-containing protein n=1 Tax=Phaedon cochleariae TaxID=80249 RepID=A0A9N9SHX3_PHACE|nr:unnamed protein product [Phaedon cochleariae]